MHAKEEEVSSFDIITLIKHMNKHLSIVSRNCI